MPQLGDFITDAVAYESVPDTWTELLYPFNFDVDDGSNEQSTIEYIGKDAAGSVVKRYKSGMKDAYIECEFEIDWTDTTGNWAVLQGLKDSDTPTGIRYYPNGMPASGESKPYFQIDALILVQRNAGSRDNDKETFTLRAVPHANSSEDPAWGVETVA